MKFKMGDVLVGLFVILAIVIFIIPFPAVFLDIFLTINIALALLILLVPLCEGSIKYEYFSYYFIINNFISFSS